MRKVIWVAVAAVGLMVVTPLPGWAGRPEVAIGVHIGAGHRGPHGYYGHRGHWSHYHRPYWGPRIFIGGVFPGPWYPYGYYGPPAVVVPAPSRDYDPPAPPPPEEYWYYCRNPEGYYPYVETCPGGWMKVVPDTVPPDR
jgi:hypothetical protein